MKSSALGDTIIARIHGLLKRSPTLTPGGVERVACLVVPPVPAIVLLRGRKLGDDAGLRGLARTGLDHGVGGRIGHGVAGRRGRASATAPAAGRDAAGDRRFGDGRGAGLGDFRRRDRPLGRVGQALPVAALVDDVVRRHRRLRGKAGGLRRTRRAQAPCANSRRRGRSRRAGAASGCAWRRRERRARLRRGGSETETGRCRPPALRRGASFGIGTAAATCSAVSCSGTGTTEAVTRERCAGRVTTSASSSSSRTLRAATTAALDFCFCAAGALLEATRVSGPFDMMRASCASGTRGQCRTLPTSMWMKGAPEDG